MKIAVIHQTFKSNIGMYTHTTNEISIFGGVPQILNHIKNLKRGPTVTKSKYIIKKEYTIAKTIQERIITFTILINKKTTMS